jgi:hypothetical protein
VPDPWTGRTDRGIPRKESDEPGESELLKHHVGIEQKDVLTRALAECLVHGPREADIDCVADEPNLRKRALDEFRASVAGGVVHDDDLANTGLTAEFFQARRKECGRPETH